MGRSNTAGQAKADERPILRVVTSAESAPTELDGLIHERIRLGIISALAANGKLAFSDLKQILDTSDGNLSVHARKLEKAGYLRTEKSFRGRVPRTEFEITEKGRAALRQYLDHMEALINSMKVR